MSRRSDPSATRSRLGTNPRTGRKPGSAPLAEVLAAARARPAAAARRGAPRRAGLEKPERRLDQRRAILPDVVDRVRDLGHLELIGRDQQFLEVDRLRLRIDPCRLGLLI